MQDAIIVNVSKVQATSSIQEKIQQHFL